ncbi:MAG: HAMP domain-containing sensor histidine kinase, partial [Caulobacterales bacterium]
MPDRHTIRIRRSTLLIFVACFVVAASMVVMAIGLANGRSSNSFSSGVTSNAHRSVDGALELLRSSGRLDARLRQYISSRDDADQFAYDMARTRFEEGRSRLLSSATVMPELAPAAADVARAARRQLSAGQAAIDRLRNGMTPSRAAAAYNSEASGIQEQLRDSIIAYVRESDHQEQTILERDARERELTNLISTILAVLATLASGVTLWALMRERRSWATKNLDIREANAKLDRAYKDAERANDAKSRFLAAASHDLRQPLHALSLYINALKRRTQGEENAKILSNMDRATQSMIAMFSRLLDLARIQSGVITPSIEDVSLQESFERVKAEFADMDVQIGSTDLVARTDWRLLLIILRNFVSNAMKHGGGHARLFAVND